MFPSVFRHRSDYTDIIGAGTVRLRTRDQVVLIVLTVVGVILAFGLPASTVGVVSEIGADGQPLYLSADLSAVPQSVADDAARSANSLFGRHGEKHDRFVQELLATYVQSQGKDVVVLFSPGGWGSGPMDAERSWGSILRGIQSELSESCVDSEVLIYQRSAAGFVGCLEEMTEILRDYASKARIMASRVRFLMAHNPDVKVVIVGESTGAQIVGEALDIFRENPQVFGVQIGPPFWYREDDTDRVLVIADNGNVADSFSRGDVFAMMGASLSALVGRSDTNGARGTILKYVRAPGHDYWWDYPAVSEQITQFLREVVGLGGDGVTPEQTAKAQVAVCPGNDPE